MSLDVKKIISSMQLEIVVEGDLTREVTGGYAGDLLSWVMGRAQNGDAWITVMGNVNAIAVSVLTDTACIILAEDSPLDEDAKTRAQAQEVTVLRSARSTFELSSELHLLLASKI